MYKNITNNYYKFDLVNIIHIINIYNNNYYKKNIKKSLFLK